MISRIEQRKEENGDCGVACVAMITNSKYEKIEKMFREYSLIDNNGDYYTKHIDLVLLLEALDYVVKRKLFQSWGKVKTPAIVKINVRKGNYWHWVVLVERKGEEKSIILDPKQGAASEIVDYRGKRGSGQYLWVSKS